MTEINDSEESKPEKITPWVILDLLKPIIKDEFIASCRADRAGLRLSFPNGQKFHLTIEEIE